MVAFTSNAIFTVFIVFLSFGDIHAQPTASQIANTEKLRKECFDTINNAFTGDDVLKHAQTAITNYVIEENMNDDLAAYITSLMNNSNARLISPASVFCKLYKYLSEGSCEIAVKYVFGDEPAQALDNAFRQLLPAHIEAFYQHFLKIEREINPNVMDFNYLMEYWNLIVRNVEVYNDEDGMLPKKEFCDDKHKMPK